MLYEGEWRVNDVQRFDQYPGNNQELLCQKTEARETKVCFGKVILTIFHQSKLSKFL
jgi:hypothetical protein